MPANDTKGRVMYRGKFLTVVKRTVELPGRGRATIDVIEHPPCATIVPLTDDGRVVMIRQWRPVLGEWLWELPAGKLDPGESAEAGARRELEEETGQRAGVMTWLTGFYPSPGSMTEWMDVWIARGLTRSRAQRDADEVIRVRRFTVAQVERMLESGKIKDAKSLVGLLAYLRGGSTIRPRPGVPRAVPPSRRARSASSGGRRR